jgi:superfamily II DNA or RNA helicase
MELRTYQKRAQQDVFRAWKDHKRVVAVLPTGAGKTVTGASVVKMAVAKGHKVVWLAHRSELIAQAKATLERVVGCRVGVVDSGPDRDDTAPVQVASIQTLVARGTLVEATLLVVDECHHMAEGAPAWAKVLEQYADIHWLGLTATPERGDGTGLAPLWQHLVNGAKYSELLILGQLLPCRVVAPKERAKGLAANPVDAYLQHAKGTKAVVYTSTVAEADLVAQEFCQRGVPASSVHGATEGWARKGILGDFERGELQVVVNVYVLTEGWDAPVARTCILARSCGAAGTFIQIAGRVMRPNPEDLAKTDCLLIDLSGASRSHGHPQADRTYSLHGQGITVEGLAKKRKPPQKTPEERQMAEERKAILERGLHEMEPLSLEARAEWEKLQHLCKGGDQTVSWAQRQFTTRFGTQAPSNWITAELKAIEFRRLQKDASDRGYKRGWAGYRFKNTFGEWPAGFRK